MSAVLPCVEVVAEAGGCSVLIPGLPIVVDGDTVGDATLEMIDALREYARDWHEYLRDAPNHRENRDLVQMIDHSDDDQLRNWIIGSSRDLKAVPAVGVGGIGRGRDAGDLG